MTRRTAAGQVLTAVAIAAAGLSLAVGWALIAIGRAVALPAGRVRS